MLLNKIKPILTLFFIHIYMYSLIYVLLYDIAKFIITDRFEIKELLISCIISPLYIMYFGDIPFFILLIPITFFIIMYFKPNNTIFNIYIISVVLTNVLMYLILFIKSNHSLEVIGRIEDNQEYIYNKLFFMIPSLLITISLNRLIFKNKLV
jgi:hypothetical protein